MASQTKRRLIHHRWHDWLQPAPYCVTIAGKDLTVTARDFQLAQGLARLGARREQQAWRLVELRPDFRYAIRHRLIAGLVYAQQFRQPDREGLLVLLWLLGRIKGSLALAVLKPYRRHRDARVRRETARSLRRVEAWAELRTMRRDPDERVRRLTFPRPMKPFQARLDRFMKTTSKPGLCRVETAPRPRLFVDEPIGPGRPARSAAAIRALYIRLLVHGWSRRA